MEREKQKEADRAREAKEREERLKQEKLRNDLSINQMPSTFDSEPSAYHIKSKFVMPFLSSILFLYNFFSHCQKKKHFS